MKDRELIIHNYIRAYNEFDADALVRDLAPDVFYENVADDAVAMSIRGTNNIKEQFVLAQDIFMSREIHVKNIKHTGDHSEVDLPYQSILAIPIKGRFPKGAAMESDGNLLFKFLGNTIIEIVFMLDDITTLNNII